MVRNRFSMFIISRYLRPSRRSVSRLSLRRSNDHRRCRRTGFIRPFRHRPADGQRHRRRLTRPKRVKCHKLRAKRMCGRDRAINEKGLDRVSPGTYHNAISRSFACNIYDRANVNRPAGAWDAKLIRVR